MGKLVVKDTKLQDVKIITPAVFGDNRGFFTETYSDRDFKEAGIDFNFIQDNQSLSSQAGVLRGLHFQRGKAAQTKLIRVVTGAVLDVIDLQLIVDRLLHCDYFQEALMFQLLKVLTQHKYLL